MPGCGGERWKGRSLAAAWRLVLFFVLLVALTVGLSAAWAWSGMDRLTGASMAGRLLPPVAAVFAASWVMMSFIESSSPGALGWRFGRRAIGELAGGVVVGAAVVSAVVVVMVVGGWLRWQGGPPSSAEWLSAGLGAAVTLGLAALWEEAVFRGYPFQVLAEALGPAAAIGLTAILFGAAHGANPGFGWIGFGNTVLAGILLGLVYWKTYSLTAVTGLHLAWNWTMGFAAGLPVSGLKLAVPGYSAEVGGPILLTGGAYGPEGGVLLTAAILGAILWIRATRRLRRDPAVVGLGPLPERGTRGGARRATEVDPLLGAAEGGQSR